MSDMPLAHPGARRLRHQSITGDRNFLAATDYTTANALVAAKAKYTIYIQNIHVQVTTDNAATLTFQDTTGTPVIIAKTKPSPGVGPIVFDFGEEGRALPTGKGFNVLMSATGLAGDIHWEGYRKLTDGSVGVVPSDL